MAFTQVPLNHHHLLSLWVNELTSEALLFEQHSKTLNAISPLQVSMLLAIDDGLSKDAISQLLSEQGVSETQISNAYQQVVAWFNAEEPTAEQAEAGSLSYQNGQYPELHAKAISQPLAITQRIADIFYVTVSNTVFSISVQTQTQTKDQIQQQALQWLFTQAKTILQPICLNDADTANPRKQQSLAPQSSQQKSNKNREKVALQLCFHQQNFALRANGIVVEQVNNIQQLLPLLIDRLQILAYQIQHYQLVFHGAALKHREQPITLMLPGKSGVGKSTLATHLTQADFALYSDEIIAFDPNNTLFTIGLPIAIKAGSWQAVQQYYPALPQQPVWQRLDGRQIKYVWPREFVKGNQLANKASKTIILCPNYQQHAEPSMVKLTTSEALTVMTQGGYQLGHELSNQSANDIIEYFDSLTAFQLTYSTTEQAMAMVSRLLANVAPSEQEHQNNILT
ncbi:hypothetical protein QWY77_07655 [Thalassotalea ponticola]|uniref:hypothetical protein n=1 Tax=Thalassotalea ponticola TaxID=1523392 RepID=UPI0025B298B3|nr:hypothetical protein [Thalassotalea ponticola]MDN3652636.1 hypothetical protein [Thalassotalea ponticola]